jgi:predicted flap endonuclease-1-like 5' DNA nuclease
MSVRSELELAESISAAVVDDAHELEEHEFTLDLDELDRPAQHMRAVPPPPPPPRRSELRRMPPAALPAAMRSSRSPSGVFPIADVEQALAASHGPKGVTAADAEISRLKAQLRARDAYVVEMERALDEWTTQLGAAAIHSAEDLVQLLGRARGHAYRVAELEAELQQLKAENTQLAASVAPSVPLEPAAVTPAGSVGTDSNDRQREDNGKLRRVRGIGRRYAKQLEGLGITHVKQIASWTNADVSRVAGQLKIQPSRIKRESWIEQARSLSSD